VQTLCAKAGQLFSNHTLVLLLLIEQVPGRSCGYCSYVTDATRVAHFKRKSAAFAARVTASNATAAAVRAAEPVCAARFKRKRAAAREAASRAAYLVVRATAYHEAAYHP
jgi:hypothetical protein